MAKKLELEDVGKKIITVIIRNDVTGEVKEVDIETPTSAEWRNAILDIQFPNPRDYAKQRMVNGKKEDYVDVNDPEYLQKKDDAHELIGMRRVTQALLGGGNFPKLLDMPLEDATKALMEKADRSIMQGVKQALNSLMSGVKGGVEAKVAAFPRTSVLANSREDLPEEEPDLSAMEGAE